ncbi:MAG: S41 family peptidase [Parcubacteria group bacterium]|jgi:carboxyl-terminal processing protease
MEEINNHIVEEGLPENERNFEKNKKLMHRYVAFFVIVFLILGSFGMGFSRGKQSAETGSKIVPLNQAIVESKNPTNSQIVDFSLFWKVWDLLKDKYVDKNSLDAQKMMYGAIEGMLKATGDHYTTFFDPAATKSFSQDLEGSFEGIGAELGIKDNILTVIAPLDGSPSAKAGLRAGDKIVKIGDRITADVRIDEAVDLIRGKKGTTVTLTILHAGDQETKEIVITRDVINVKSVKLEFKSDNIAHLKITKFGDTTSKEFNEAVNQIIAADTKGIVLDLRNNPGGYLEKAVDLASRLIPKGKVVVMEEDNTGQRDTLYTTGGDKLSNLPIVVLINEGSASASEILAGALRDNRNVQLIGKKSFGKGSVQELINLPQNTSVKITVAKWLTPNGDSIMEKGINPDTEVDLSLDDFNNNRDPQLDKALEIMQGMVK